ncbi:NXPE family member 3-like isoform X1 [Takifugu rubripes]|uniref:Neurexophilin and PC-esterase domain family member 3 n=1 Tax=Takifugu rubripes TaxID=31033 RepID=H2SDQ4_TAKRU|nr:NXPE family member 3-like isoform X1 [Takifugu rubripes]XP_029681244.1 NXPE family member 3-like isoform X1 [Takifugu rubripes]XP_029681245.1 NXPE family member 3-like isoform X1 [Takifugu rubripes]XP_029681246.1 NXPE family member 3-like isoform X1 [Takifugu rubripes]XP_029681247.1 NXPE family member 3-like isoform X1 [Takifugu rubripes]XP_029681248.1 NXPE family member 3-like isoform X1 [Takifugu rubripes]XP_029681249.1 NXPE family member 3-like isoform X1 [Takifugu rubripes]
MKVRTRTCSPKRCAYFLVCVLTMLWIMNCLKTQTQTQTQYHEPKDTMATVMVPKVYTYSHNNHQNFCVYRPLSPKDALEEKLLLESISWPATPVWPEPLSLERTTDPAHSTFTILPRNGGGQWQEGDRLEALIKLRDFRGLPKTSGGDVLLARMHDPVLSAGVAGQVVDHGDGSYSAFFSLLWKGRAQVEVTLVHPSEAVTVLRRLTKEQPDRISFQSLFSSGGHSETTTCNVCLRPTQQPICNYVDPRTGEPWVCLKPKTLGCHTRINHSKGAFVQDLKPKEELLFQSGVNMKVSIPPSGPDTITVLRRKKGAAEVKSGNLESPVGYYYQGVWRALDGTTIQQFHTSSAVCQCLKGKMIHLYGDSTIRQWYEYLVATVPDLKDFNLHSRTQVGPFMALDYTNNIMVTYRCHGPPIRFVDIPVSELRYIANELDGLVGGANTVVVIGIWSHFSTFPHQVYIRRLLSIRGAVERLLDRAPDTLVVIRTANLKELTLYETLTNSDWYSMQRDKLLRAMFRGLNVRLVDAWEMGLAHELPHSLHPQPAIIKNMTDVLLSYICTPSTKR